VVIAIAYSALVIAGITAALVIFRSTRVGFRAEPAGHDVLASRELKWGGLVVVFLVVLLALTIFELPYGSDKNAKADQTIKLTGRQFAWTVDPTRVKAGVRTAIDLRSTDVSHGVGIYDPDGVLMKQVNVIPGVAQRFVMTFNEPGTYEFRCLEFCGVDHHLMRNELEVTR
jgi:cytochrome c oxidase subunit 2